MSVVKADEATAGGDQPAEGKTSEVRVIKASPKRLDDVKHLWFMLHAHHIAMADKRRGPTRSDEESWQIKRGWYEAWLAEEGSFLMIAELHGEVVGYAVVRVMEPDPTPTWILPPKKTEMEAFAVLPGLRRYGVGKKIMDAIKVETHRLGIERIGGAVIGGNMDATRFYEREGGFVTYIKFDYLFTDEHPVPPDPGIVDETGL